MNILQQNLNYNGPTDYDSEQDVKQSQLKKIQFKNKDLYQK